MTLIERVRSSDGKISDAVHDAIRQTLDELRYLFKHVQVDATAHRYLVFYDTHLAHSDRLTYRRTFGLAKKLTYVHIHVPSSRKVNRPS